MNAARYIVSLCCIADPQFYVFLPGSSNDIMEFMVKSDCPPVELRAGPKSYTFGGFVKALETFHPNIEQQEGDDEDSGEGDMEAFLNECDNEEHEDPFGEYDANGGDDEEEWNDSTLSAEAIVKDELLALDSLRAAMEHAEKRYSLEGAELKSALTEKEPFPRHCAAILISSEKRTLRLHLRAIEIIKTQLEDNRVPRGGSQPVNTDEALVENQADDLARAFMTIRYPDYL